MPLLAELIAAEPLACIPEAQTEKRPWQLPRKPREPEIAKTRPAFVVAVLSNVVREYCPIRMWKLCVYIDLFTQKERRPTCVVETILTILERRTVAISEKMPF